MIGLGLVVACRRGPTTEVPVEAAPAASMEAKVDFQEDPTKRGLGMRLYEARPEDGGADRVPVAPSTPLDAATITRLLARLPALEIEPDDAAAFALREGPMPPPRTGDTVTVTFPSASDAPAPVVESGPLTVVRRAPEGEVPMAPHLSVTFSRAMVPVTSQEEAAKTVPVRLTPTPKGDWRWLGTKTLVFEPDPRFPMATAYQAEIPAGTRSTDGTALTDAVSWTFATPPLVLQSYWPDGGRRRGAEAMPQPLNPVLFLGFDQAVDPAALVPHLRLKGGTGDVALRLATKEEIAKVPEVESRVGQAQPDRRLALTPTVPLARATTYEVVVPEGAPSAEGPRLTTKDQSFSFRTYGPMQVSAPECWNQHPCPPTAPWSVAFTNPIDLDRFDAAAFTVTPAVPGLQVNAHGNTVSLQGLYTGRTTYTLTVAASVPDVFGQTLGAASTFKVEVGPAEQTLRGPNDTFVTVDPSGPPQVSFFTTNHKALRVTVHRVAPDDWAAWVAWNEKYRWADARKAPIPGTKVHSGTVTVAGEPDRQVETAFDLAPYLTGTSGQFIVQVEPTVQPKERWQQQEWLGWVQVTKLGLTVFQERDALTVWSTDLGTGKPRADVETRLLGGPADTGRTGADGLVRLSFATEANAVVARAGDDVAILPQSPGGWGGGWYRLDDTRELRWFVFDDKNLYKPGETVHVRGWLRTRTPGVDGDLVATRTSTVRWSAFSSQGNPLGEGTVTVTGLGGFTLDLPLPKTPNLGTARIDFTAADGDTTEPSTSLSFEIQEYRTPEFAVSASGGDGVYALGEDAIVDVSAAYYAGGGLPSAPVRWEVSAAPATFVPPGRGDWSFGPWSPWWREWGGSEPYVEPERLSGVTDSTGEHHLGIHFESLDPVRPMTVTAEATVEDVNRQAWTAAKSFLVHPADVYVGLKTPKAYVEARTPVEVEAIVVDREGRAVPGQGIEVVFERLVWKHTAKGWDEVAEAAGSATIPGAGKTRFVPEAGGSYRVVATVKDSHGRKNETTLQVWVTGEQVVPDRGVAQEQVTLVPEKKSYAVGESANVLVQAPFSPAEGVLTVRAGGLLLETRAFHLDGASTTLAIPVTERHVPDFTVAVDLVGARARAGDDGTPRTDLPKRVAYAAGSLTFEVPPLLRTLTVAVTPAVARLEPGGETSVEVVVTGPDGKPVPNAELAVVAVDEAVLALTGYKLPDPLATFYAARGDGVSSHHLRQWVQLVDPTALVGGMGDAGPGDESIALQSLGYAEGGGGFGGVVSEKRASKNGAIARSRAAPAPSTVPMADAMAIPDAASTQQIQVRSDFAAVALWAPSVYTDLRGVATVPLRVPDSLTRYRVMVVAVAKDTLFGSGEADVTARLPLMIRPSPPRFLNFGDRVEIPVVLQNQTDAPLTVDLALRTSNLALLSAVTDPLPQGSAAIGAQAGRRVTVPANDRVEVRFPAAAAMAGTARIQLAAVSGAHADAANVELPVWTPATTEAFATYGTFDGASAQTSAERLAVAAPPEVWPQFGGLEVTVSSTQLQSLTDAFVYLVRYPYDCNEQLASRLLGVAALRDVLGAFASAELPAKGVLEATVAADIERLAERQNVNGGWGFWRRGDEGWPYLGVHVTHALVRAKAKGYAVEPRSYDSALGYLRKIEHHLPRTYSQESKWAIRAYALHVLSLAGDPNVGKAKALVAEAGVDELGAESMGWLLPTLVEGKATKEVAAIRTWLQNHVTETAAGAHFVTSYSDGAQVLLHSDRVADGVLLEALLRTEPKSELIPKLVDGLLAHRKAGRWANTTENAHVLLALDRYFHVYEGVTPAFLARVWLGTGVAGEQRFEGRSTDRAQIDVPMAWLQERGAQDLVVGKEGAGRLYYRVGLRYAPLDLDPEAADYGFAVTRAYEPVDDPADVTRAPDGTWTIRAGARVRVRLTMATPMRRYHVALVDPLPAGLEVLNPDLAVTGAIPQDPSAPPAPYWWWMRTWYDHENLRDERVEAFASLLWDGVHTYTYVARATTPGDFVVPPTKAEEMYSPETFGRGAGDRVVVR
ncbi:MAG: Ig-like domain-containing protein [Pseudomonadota bacterium]|nr:Ig-like domain-containing protein [Pseudomonadota bacterium]